MAPPAASAVRRAPGPFVGTRQAADHTATAPNDAVAAPAASTAAAESALSGLLSAVAFDDVQSQRSARTELPSVEELAPPGPHAHAPIATPSEVDSSSPSTPSDLPWLDTSASDVPPPSEALPFPPYAPSAGKDAVLEETKHALDGLPYFDVDGDVHEKGDPQPVRASGTMHRVEFDLAGVLDRLASRVRSGDLVVPDVDPLAGEGAALAAVLAALLRHRG